MVPDRIQLHPSGAEVYLDEKTNAAVIADAAGGALPLDPAEAEQLRAWLSAVIALGRSRTTATWKAKKSAPIHTLEFQVGEEHAALVVCGERLHLDYEEQESLVEFVLQQFGKRRWQGIVAKALDEAVEAEIERRARENER